MFVKNLKIYNFRNYVRESVQFCNGLNIISGENAQGKTNLIEGIYLLATGTSPRIVSDKELIKLDAKIATVKAVVETLGGDVEIEMQLSRGSKKCATINGMSIAKIGELIGNLRVIYFSPDEMSLIKDSPDYRRRFMDVDLSQMNRQYFYALNKYNKILKQRNTLLKGDNKKEIEETISVWDDSLAKVGAWIIVKRREFCQKLSYEAKRIHNNIAQKEELNIQYSTQSDKLKEKDIENDLKELLISNRERDIRLGYTSVGPQRDDIKITLNGIDLRTFGSQGQQRTGTLSLKLAEIEIFKEITGECPILLLDDVLSELDEKRKIKLLNYAKGGQTIITCTDFNFKLDDSYTQFIVKSGKVERV